MKTPKASPKSFAFNITPLIDVTFLLIVFFVMSNRLIQDEFAVEAQLPREASGETQERDDSNLIVVNALDAETYYYGVTRVTLDELREKLRREKARSTRKIAVRIRANRDVPYSAIEPILVACAETGVPDVSFAVVER